MKEFFPPDVKFVSLLRHPISQIESTFYYQEYGKLFRKVGLNFTSSSPNSTNNNSNGTDSSSAFEEFFKSPMYYYQRASSLDESLPLMHNGMFFDLGYSFFNRTTYHDDEIYKAIQQLDKDLDFVMITEHFDESLVLLMREFCWTFDDIIYIKHNQRAHKKKHITQNVRLRRKILKWNHADFLLYQHFNRTLWKRIEKQGDRFWADFKFFKAKLDNFKMRCSFQNSIKGTSKKSVKFVGQQMGESVSSFDRPLCERAALSELDYIKRIRRHYTLERLQEHRTKIKRLQDLLRISKKGENKYTTLAPYRTKKPAKRKLENSRSQNDILESTLLEKWRDNMNSIPDEYTDL